MLELVVLQTTIPISRSENLMDGFVPANLKLHLVSSHISGTRYSPIK